MTILAYLTFYILCILNIVWGIRKKKSNVLYAIALVVIFVIMTFNYDGPDIEAYRLTYELVGNANNLHGAISATYMENGYAFLMFCANRIGLDFYAFRIILTIVCLTLFVSIIKFYKVNPNFIIGLYMAYVFFFDTIQLRNFIIQFIILFATRYLFDKSAKSMLKYLICIVVAASIHTLSWLFLSLLLIRFVKTKVGYQRIFAMAASLFVLCMIMRPVLPQVVDILAKILKRGSGYFSGTLRFNYLVVMVLHMFGIIPLYLYRKNITNKESKQKVTAILRIQIIMGLFLPLCFINSNFNRIFRNILIFDTIGLTLLYQNLKKNTESNDVTLMFQLILVFGWLATDLFRNRDVNLINSVIEYNLVYGQMGMANIGQYFAVAAICLLIIFVIKRISTLRGFHFRKEIKCA